MLTRLANIELAHIAALRAAVESGAPWVLLLEDDARSDDPGRFAEELDAFTQAARDSGEPSMMNLSQSFTPRQLGISEFLTPVANVGQPPWHTYRADRAVTNTVCAVLYRADAATSVLRALTAIPLQPIIPIDFKLNDAILRMPRDSGLSCWVVSPAPLLQGSGVPATYW